MVLYSWMQANEPLKHNTATQVNWSTLWMTFRERDWRSMLVKPMVAILVLIPVGIFTGGLQQLDYVFCPAHRCAEVQVAPLAGASVWPTFNTTVVNCTAPDGSTVSQ